MYSNFIAKDNYCVPLFYTEFRIRIEGYYHNVINGTEHATHAFDTQRVSHLRFDPTYSNLVARVLDFTTPNKILLNTSHTHKSTQQVG